jgi:hypothetical protein
MKAAGRRLLRLYPPSWRSRYEGEVLAVLEEHEVTLATRLDLLLGALDAWRQTGRREGRKTSMTASQSRSVLKVAAVVAVLAIAAMVAGQLQILVPDIPNNTSFVWLAGGLLLCATAGVYAAARGFWVLAGALGGALTGACTMALVWLVGILFEILYGWLGAQAFDTHPLTSARAASELVAAGIATGGAAAVGAVLAVAGWLFYRYCRRQVAIPLSELFTRLALAARAFAQ